MDTEIKDPKLAEVAAMGKVVEALTGLDNDTISRVLHWAASAYGLPTASVSPSVGRSVSLSGVSAVGSVGNVGATTDQYVPAGGLPSFSGLPELYNATQPESDADKVLVTSFWAQEMAGNDEFTSQAINTALKNLGYPIKNITSAFNNLKARKPAHILQLKKSGTSRQARKTYRLTTAGKTAVETMIHQH